jgi:hypothetical protein
VRNGDLEVTQFSITPGTWAKGFAKEKIAIERDPGQSERTASVDQTDARNCPTRRTYPTTTCNVLLTLD